jgi:hypothetical protein
LFAKPLQESEAVPESLRTIDQGFGGMQVRPSRQEIKCLISFHNLSCSSGAIFQPAASKMGLLPHLYIFHAFTEGGTIKTGGVMSRTAAQNPENCIFNL